MGSRLTSIFSSFLLLLSCATGQPESYGEFVSVYGSDHKKVPMLSGNYQIVIRQQRDAVIDETLIGLSDGTRTGIRPEYPQDLGRGVILFCDTVYAFDSADKLISISLDESSCNLNER
ncbi:MAG: hypothetical protein DHS20C12_16000 [Pseudohongiella sp.]|nr:MAG: hypothetical protein DHS20C12_16000 [Pseudohongiella sp.]